jgi:ABC-2 type transport system ATP-binding protein
MVQFNVFPEAGEMDMVHYQRSADVPVGLPINLIEWTAFGMMVAYMTNLKLRTYTHYLPNPQVYDVQLPQIEELLTLFDIADLGNRVTGALSAGEKTRLNLAKGLLNDPELLLLDEPTASLDPEMADTVRKALKKIQKEKNLGILYTSHNMPEVEEICDRVVFINEGKTIAQGSPLEVAKLFQTQSLEQAFIKIVRGNVVSEKTA